MENEVDGAGRLVIGWDTCTSTGVLAVGRGGEPLAEELFREGRGHAGWLMSAVGSMMAGLGAGPGDLSLVAVGTGPGNYTGLKVGVSTARALAAALAVPLLGIQTHDIIASAADGGADGVLVVTAAGRGRLYAAAYRAGSATPERVSECERLEAGGVIDMARSPGWRSVELLGAPPRELEEGLRESGIAVESRAIPHPRGRDILALADAFSREGLTRDPMSVLPVYLKSPV